MEQTVQLSHLDVNGFLSLGNVVAFMQDCSFSQLMSEAVLKDYFQEHQIGVFIASRQLDIKRLPTLGEKLRIETGIYKCTSVYAYRNVMLYDEANELLVASNVISFFVDMRHLHVTRIPQRILDHVTIYPQYAMDYQPRKVLISSTFVSEKKEKMFVWRFFLDSNRHVNNAKYISMAQEFIPVDFVVKRMRVEYQHAARYGDCIYPKVYILPNGYIVDLASEAGKHYAIVEFTN